jgi:hypothetical protein
MHTQFDLKGTRRAAFDFATPVFGDVDWPVWWETRLEHSYCTEVALRPISSKRGFGHCVGSVPADGLRP